jgi:hypothetical protein
MPGKPYGLGHYEFITSSSTRGSPRLLQQAVGCRVQGRMPTSCRVSEEPSDGGLADFLCGHKRAFVGPQDETSPTAARQSSTAKRLFWGPSSATRGGVGLPAWSPQEQTRGASAWAPSQQGLQLDRRQRPHWLDNAELDSSSLARAASPVVASSEPTSIPSWALCSYDCLSLWNSLFGKTFRFFFITNRKWAREKQLAKIKFRFVCRPQKSSETFLQWMFLRNESKRIHRQLFEMWMGEKS